MSFYLIVQITSISILGLNAILLYLKGHLVSKYLKYFGSTLLLISIYFIVFTFFYNSSLLKNYPHLLLTLSPLNFIVFPLFYFSVRSISTGGQYFRKKDIIHLLPAFLRILDATPIYLLPREDKLALINKYFPSVHDLGIHASGFIPGIWTRIICLILMIFYSIQIIKLFINLPIEILNKFKNEKFNNILFGTFVATTIIYTCTIIVFFINVLFYFLEVKFDSINYFLYFIVLSTILVYNIYLFLRLEFSSNIDSHKKFIDSGLGLQSTSFNSFNNNPLDWEDTGLNKLEVESKLNYLLEEEKIFLVKNLTVNSFAIKADLPMRLLPHILNLAFDKTFKELINERRVKFAKEKIETGFLVKYTVEALSEECGFNSRITFYNTFKNDVGLSPNLYWNKIQKDSK